MTTSSALTSINDLYKEKIIAALVLQLGGSVTLSHSQFATNDTQYHLTVTQMPGQMILTVAHK